MKDLISYFSETFNYLEGIIIENQLDKNFENKLNEQKENLEDFRNLINQYEKDMLDFNSFESIGSDETLDKLMKIHKFITDFEWHISEISELKDEVIKICSSKRE
ncbi:hypothetical protein [Vallitalea guaymasensis]|uniref:hypothetical protein n=1 Tax=Vallitalea guaymasensis TaxID=1185412 RepID=UPI000DE1D751|nr:hypothetical protein [Vallitalea guaymasensis]